jgi:hypothetical protein
VLGASESDLLTLLIAWEVHPRAILGHKPIRRDYEFVPYLSVMFPRPIAVPYESRKDSIGDQIINSIDGIAFLDSLMLLFNFGIAVDMYLHGKRYPAKFKHRRNPD